MAIPKGITAELRPLARHLDAKGVEWEKSGGHAFAMSGGKRVTMFSMGSKTVDNRTIKNILATLRREWPDLIEGYSGPGSRNGRLTDKARAEKGKTPWQKRRPGGNTPFTGARAERAEAQRIRLRAALDEHFEGEYRQFVEWTMMTGKELGLRVWTSVNAGQQAVRTLLAGGTVPREWTQDLIDAGLDAAYGTPENPATYVERKSASRAMPQRAEEPQRVTIEPATEESPEPEEVEIETPHEELEPEEPAVQEDEPTDEGGSDIPQLRKRYVDMLFKLAESGDEKALDRIERILGL